MRRPAFSHVFSAVACVTTLVACSTVLGIGDLPPTLDGGVGDEGSDAAGGCNCAASSASVETATCEGGTCSYVCAAGYSDCNEGMGADLDGCECATPVCCNGQCAVKHDDGLGTGKTTFYDCVPQGTYDQTLALDACTQFTGSLAQCSMGSCDAPSPPTDMAACSDGSTVDCVCWTYAGPDVGLVYPSGTAGNCQCAVPTNSRYQ